MTKTALRIAITTCCMLMFHTPDMKAVEPCCQLPKKDASEGEHKNDSIPVPNGPRIRDLVREKFPDKEFLLGATIGTNDFNSPAGTILAREYSYVTPENDFKHATIRRDSSKWNWTRANAWLNWIEKHDQVLRMHCPLDRQHARWLERADTAVLRKEVKNFYQGTCQRYGNHPRIEWMDVCNELILYDGSWRDENHLLPNPLFKLGREVNSTAMPSWVVEAIKICRRYAPDLKLIWNQDGEIIFDEMWETLKASVEYLESIGCGIDGIGWQAHIGHPHEAKQTTEYDAYLANPKTSEKLAEMIAWCHERELEFHITEADVYLPESILGPSKEQLEIQAGIYSELLRVCLEGTKTGPVYMNMWSATDGMSWQSHRFPALFDEAGTPKPAYYSIQEVLKNWH